MASASVPLLLLAFLLIDLPFTAGSLRTGGATAAVLDGTPVDHLRFKGRWRNPRTLEHYVQEIVAALALSRLPPHVDSLMEAVRAAFPARPLPPPQEWSHFGSRATQIRAQMTFMARSRRTFQDSAASSMPAAAT